MRGYPRSRRRGRAALLSRPLANALKAIPSRLQSRRQRLSQSSGGLRPDRGERPSHRSTRDPRRTRPARCPDRRQADTGGRPRGPFIDINPNTVWAAGLPPSAASRSRRLGFEPGVGQLLEPTFSGSDARISPLTDLSNAKITFAQAKGLRMRGRRHRGC
jgi:hypothetical protein